MTPNKLKVSKNYIEILCDRNDTDTQSKVSSFYPLHHNRILTSFKVSTRCLPEVLAMFRPSFRDTAPGAILDSYEAEIQARELIADLLKNGAKESGVVNDRLTLAPHQQLGREIARVRNRFGFFYDTRTGKTPLALSIINDDLQQNPDHKWLVICPLILINEAWLEDTKRFFPEIEVVNCHASTKMKRLAQIGTPAQLYITNTESFVNYREYFDILGLTGVFVDESSDMKSPKSKISQELVDFAQTVNNFYLLSGTPAPNGKWEYYMQLRAIDLCSMPQSYTQFEKRYFINMSYNPQFKNLVIKQDMEGELIAQIKKYAMYVDKEDVLDTPGRTFYEIELQMPSELKKQYSKLRQDLYLEVKGSVITAAGAAAKLNKLNQVTSGFIIDTKAVKYNSVLKANAKQGLSLPYHTTPNNIDNVLEDEWHLLDLYRFEALFDLLNNTCAGEQVIIWCNYKKEFEIIKSIIDDNHSIGRAGYVYGDVSIAEKEAAIKDFKQGRIQYLVANPASADKGLTLTNCHNAIYFSLNWSYELFKQSTERIYGDKRIQPKHCNYYILIAKGTVDRMIYRDVLQGKKINSETLLNHLKAEEFAE